jgi:hypothetical protein
MMPAKSATFAVRSRLAGDVEGEIKTPGNVGDPISCNFLPHKLQPISTNKSPVNFHWVYFLLSYVATNDCSSAIADIKTAECNVHCVPKAESRFQDNLRNTY